jgi:hypothetical protein
MMNKWITIICVLFLGLGCRAPLKKNPTYQQIGANPYGSNISVIYNSTYQTKGELIAVDSQSIIILKKHVDICVVIPIDEIREFKLYFARNTKKSWLIPIFGLSTLYHGFYLQITAPVNLIITSAIAVHDNNKLKYDQNDISYQDLHMFARFPQGIPAGVTLKEVR